MIEIKLQSELRCRFNPDGSLLREHQLRMVEMLKYFDDICQKNGISYWLSSGNCLGLVRHGGFIPWDDDLDVEMLREDYLKFEKIFKETDKYALQTWRNDKMYFYPFSKLRDKDSLIEEEHMLDINYSYRGIYIDILQLEYTPRIVSVIYAKLCIGCLYRLLNKQSVLYKSLYIGIKYIIYKTIPIARLLFTKIHGNKLRHTYGVGWIDKTRDIKAIFPLKRVYFEGIEVNVPNDLNAYLSAIYGDYMKMPSYDKIKSHTRKIRLHL